MGWFSFGRKAAMPESKEDDEAAKEGTDKGEEEKEETEEEINNKEVNEEEGKKKKEENSVIANKKRDAEEKADDQRQLQEPPASEDNQDDSAASNTNKRARRSEDSGQQHQGVPPQFARGGGGGGGGTPYFMQFPTGAMPPNMMMQFPPQFGMQAQEGKSNMSGDGKGGGGPNQQQQQLQRQRHHNMMMMYGGQGGGGDGSGPMFFPPMQGGPGNFYPRSAGFQFMNGQGGGGGHQFNNMPPPPAMMMRPPIPPSRGICLALQCDLEQLSDYQVLVRQQLEIFEAGPEDCENNCQGRKRQVVLHQVGLRCRHCASYPLRSRGRGAVYYPAKLLGVYQACQNMTSSHLCVACQHIPPALKEELKRLRARKDQASGGKQYWADGCRALGVYEVERGLRLERNNDESSRQNSSAKEDEQKQQQQQTSPDEPA